MVWLYIISKQLASSYLKTIIKMLPAASTYNIAKHGLATVVHHHVDCLAQLHCCATDAIIVIKLIRILPYFLSARQAVCSGGRTARPLPL